MTEIHFLLRRVGIVLLVSGTADVVFSVVVAAIGQSTMFSVNVGSILAGISLLNGNLNTSRTVAWFVGLALGFVVVGFAVALFVLATSLVGVHVLVRNWQGLNCPYRILHDVIVAAMLIWLYRQLNAKTIRNAWVGAGIASHEGARWVSRSGLLVGSVIAIGTLLVR